MFSVLSSQNQAWLPVSAAIVLATLLLALALSVMAVVQVLEEYRLYGDWLVRPKLVGAERRYM